MRDLWAYVAMAVLVAAVVAIFHREGQLAAERHAETMQPAGIVRNLRAECAIQKTLTGPAVGAYTTALGYDACTEELARMLGQGRSLPMKASR